MDDVSLDFVLQNFIPVPETGCWLWLGRWNVHKYGQVNTKHHKYYGMAHRVFYENMVGPIPDGMHLCHKCDTPPCVNPDHFFIGDGFSNMADMARKGRSLVGERSPLAFLTNEQAEEIRQLHGSMPNRALADRYGIRIGTVLNIVNGKRYASHPTVSKEAA